MAWRAISFLSPTRYWSAVLEESVDPDPIELEERRRRARRLQELAGLPSDITEVLAGIHRDTNLRLSVFTASPSESGSWRQGLRSYQGVVLWTSGGGRFAYAKREIGAPGWTDQTDGCGGFVGKPPVEPAVRDVVRFVVDYGEASVVELAPDLIAVAGPTGPATAQDLVRVATALQQRLR